MTTLADLIPTRDGESSWGTPLGWRPTGTQPDPGELFDIFAKVLKTAS